MTLKILSDSETGRNSYAKELDEFLENGLTSVKIPQGTNGLTRGMGQEVIPRDENSNEIDDNLS